MAAHRAGNPHTKLDTPAILSPYGVHLSVYNYTNHVATSVQLGVHLSVYNDTNHVAISVQLGVHLSVYNDTNHVAISVQLGVHLSVYNYTNHVATSVQLGVHLSVYNDTNHVAISVQLGVHLSVYNDTNHVAISVQLGNATATDQSHRAKDTTLFYLSSNSHKRYNAILPFFKLTQKIQRYSTFLQTHTKDTTLFYLSSNSHKSTVATLYTTFPTLKQILPKVGSSPGRSRGWAPTLPPR